MEKVMKAVDFEAHFYNQDYMDHMYARNECPQFVDKTATDIWQTSIFQ